MKEWKEDFLYQPISVEFDYFTEDTILYDIETTGLSRQHHFVYCIGCCTRKENTITLRQFFAESPEEEPALLTAFSALLSTFSTCITFNGMQFDEPFLRTRFKTHSLSSSVFPTRHIDLYKNCLSMKSVLSLPSLKQKSIERFLGICRDDLYTGGELIEVYHTYTKNRDEASIQLLRLHNEEDVRNMIPLLSILTYRTLKQTDVTVRTVDLSSHRTLDGKEEWELILEGQLPLSLPAPIRLSGDDYYLILEQDRIKGSIKLFSGTMKHYLSDYRRYVYLPAEDMVILKEMAAAMSADRKIPATADNCYLKKDGMFLPLPASLPITSDLVTFRKDRKEKQQYILYTEESADDHFLSHYLSAILHTCC